jgi:hypothetical protein
VEGCEEYAGDASKNIQEYIQEITAAMQLEEEEQIDSIDRVNKKFK